ncbi:MAG TPA: alpha/beta hydrolase [Synechococcales cyanobacterium M55_K2018_004]|nr:alpha/beta hydrolase [Synechococcales cyanobacterium M55_K2018_004]
MVTASPHCLAFETKGAGYPILCLHGHPGSARSMAVFTDHLSRRFCTIAPDLRGYGNSRTARDFTMADHLIDLEHLLDQQGIDRCLLLGWSLGGILAMELALQHPHRVSGLILIATAAYPRGNHPPISLADNLCTGIAALLNWIQPGWQWNIETFGKRSLFRYLVQRHTPATYRYIAAAAIPAYLQTSPQATRALMTAISTGYNRLADLHQIQCPTLVLAGESDRHITAQSSQLTAQHLPNSELRVYPNVAHLFPWEIPTTVLHDIDQWIEKNLAAVTAQSPDQFHHG